MRRLKLIWDFRGPNALRIAEHHHVHLKEYIKTSELNNIIVDFEALSDMHSIAFMVVDEDKMQPLRDILKPHRGQVFSD
jgi:hypothetical protein